jgi:hypothetical protein
VSDFLLVVEGLMADGADAAMIVDESTYLAALFGHMFAPDDGAVLGYVWCSRHGWVRSDETCMCSNCWIEAMEAQPEVEMPEPHRCDWCGKPVLWADVLATPQGRFACDLADREGMLVLEEKRQLIVMGRLCAACCEEGVTPPISMDWPEDWDEEDDDCEIIEVVEFPQGEFDDGAHWRQPAQALSPLSTGEWASEPGGDPEWSEEWGDRGERAVLETDSVATIAQVHFEGEGYITVYADMSNGRALTLFRYYEDELCFSSHELVGKTKAQALALFHEKDVAYLRS